MYSPKFKEKMLQRMLEGAVVAKLAEEAGLSAGTLHRWRRDSLAGRMADDADETVEVKNKRELTPLDKARLLAEADQIEEEELGGWLRARGLHRADLERWGSAIEDALDPAKARKRKKAEDKRVRQLERELRKKEKALAEAAALLVLRKKAQALWGDEDDDTDPS